MGGFLRHDYMVRFTIVVQPHRCLSAFMQLLGCHKFISVNFHHPAFSKHTFSQLLQNNLSISALLSLYREPFSQSNIVS
jgi:hypothetical protein